MEQAFQEAFGKGHELSVKRHPVGADYTVERENDYLDEGDREIVLEVGMFFVEIKATTVDHVRMTDVQAKKAAENSERFILCVVPLVNADAPIDAKVVMERTRFVTNIGNTLRPLVEGLAYVEASKRKVLTEGGPLSVEIKGETVRYRVDREVWTNGVSFGEVVTNLGGVN